MNIFQAEKVHEAVVKTTKATAIASAVLVSANTFAQEDMMIEEVIVSAQKKSENLQNVPISVTTLSSDELDALNIKDFADYVLQLPAASAVQRRPGQGQIFMRGISDGGNVNQSLQGPAVAIYLDESPVTMIGDNLDVHVYDIERVESLTGPQGTLYGAASQAGNLKIITKKPSSEFDSGFNLSAESTRGGDGSTMIEGFVNIPLSQNAALRFVGFNDRDGGFIDSVNDSITYPVSGITRSNEVFVEDNFNDAVKEGYRAALRVDLNENWQIDVNYMGQETSTNGVWDHNPDELGEYNVSRFYDDKTHDEWTRFSATVTGDLGFADLTFTTSSLERDFEVLSDYSHYAIDGFVEGYYTCYTYYFGPCVDPSIQFENDTHQEYDTTEIRLSSKEGEKLNWIIGAFQTENVTEYDSQWHVPAINPAAAVPGSKDLYYQTDQVRAEDESAVFGEIYYQINDKMELTLGHRKFDNETTLKGFVGTVWWPNYILGSATRPDNVNSLYDGSDSISKVNLSYQIDNNSMLYITRSEGYRPGGANRTTQLGATYDADFLTSTEFGFKSISMDGRLRLNGAMYQMDWDDIQLGWFDSSISLLGLVDNIGKANSNGFELDAKYILSDTVSVALGYANNEAVLKEDYVLRGVVEAKTGQDLPFTPDTKYNVTINVDTGDSSSLQFNYVYVDEMWNDLFYDDREMQDSYGIANLSFTTQVGDNSSMQIYMDNIFDEVAQLYINSEDIQRLTTVNRPTTVGVKFSWNYK
ncbi:MAG: TonB-dependent receptor [Gammaproteobacteria bacterium TMED234]|mgnify:FL=1|jgi:outer membrane receptor protein involved in Fe transport|nr:MAG: TonB-dependent receptor [Gammaproteobacteria bacterium TMED234]|tara:strand:+ start:550 stop:2817 length:2268 start_codon:yes stop_codon:yes gene_type:complete